MVKFLKTISEATIEKLTATWASIKQIVLNGTLINGVANEDTPVTSEDTLVTPAYMDENSVSTKHDSTMQGVLRLIQGLVLGNGDNYYINGDAEASLKSLIIDTIQSTDITTDYLTVTKKAHFFELVIDKLKSVGGTVVLTGANCKLDLVEAYDASGDLIADADTATAVAYWKCYWLAKDADGNAITNDWEEGDLAISYTCNFAEGTAYDAANRYWWRLVEAVDDGVEVKTLNGEEVEMHWMRVSNTTYDRIKADDATGESALRNLDSDAPQAGDSVMLLGSTGEDDTRKNAIVLAASRWIDNGRAAYEDKDGTAHEAIEAIQCPAIVQYMGVSSFALADARYMVLAASGNTLRGRMDIDTSGLVSYTHYAYCDDLTDDEYTTADSLTGNEADYAYMGVVTDHTSGDSHLNKNSYVWTRVRGADGDTAATVELTRENMQLLVDCEGNAVGGLWTTSGTERQYQLYTTVFVRKGSAVLTETTADTCGDGEYRVKGVNAYNCSYTHSNGAFYITGIKNVKDGVAGSDDDTGFDYDAMRQVTEAWLSIVFDIEGTAEAQKVFRIVINHAAEAVITTDTDNDSAAVVYNTRTKTFTGLSVCQCTVTKMHGSEMLPLSGLSVGGYAGMTVKADSATGTVKVTGITDTTPRTETVTITSTCLYAGVSYEATTLWRVSIRNNVSLYQLRPTASAVHIATDGTIQPASIGCNAYIVGEDDTWSEITPSDYNLTLQWATDGGDFADYSSALAADASAASYTFRLTDEEGNVHDTETVPVIQDGEDGEDAYSVQIYTDNGNIIKNGQGQVTLTAVVMKGGETLTDIPAASYSWKRTSTDTDSDTAWNSQHSGVGATITVSALEIWKRALFECQVSITK